MRTLFHRVLGCILLVAWLPAMGQGLTTLAEIRKVTDGAMERAGRGDIEGALKSFRFLTIIPPAEFDAMLGQIPLQLPGISARFGEPIGHEFLKEEKLGEALARLTYLQKFEKHAMRWYFYCYRGKGGWVINTFRFDDKIHEIF
jgi:hypothetical protein